MSEAVQEEVVVRARGGCLMLPFRWKFWRVIILLAVVGYIALVVLDQVLLWQLTKQREALRAAGLPQSFDELPIERPKEGENAAVVYRHAAAKLKEADVDDKAVEQLLPKWDCVDGAVEHWDPAHLQEAQALLAPRAPGLALVLEAQQMPGVMFGLYDNATLMSIDPDVYLPDLALVRQIARALRDQAVVAAGAGNSEEAYQWVFAGLRLGNDLRNDALLIGMLVRVAVASVAVEALNQCVVLAGPPNAQVAEKLAGELKALRDPEFLPLVINAERCFGAMSHRSMALQAGRGGRALFVSPSELFGNAQMAKLASISRLTDRAARQEALLALEANARGIAPWKKISELLLPAIMRAMTSYERMFDQCALAEIALALEAEHAGSGVYPEALEKLAKQVRAGLPALDLYDYAREGGGWTLSNAPALQYSASPSAPEKSRRVVLCHPGS